MAQAISFDNYNELTHMTDEIQFIPNSWSRLDELGIFTAIGIQSTSVTIDMVKGQLNVLNDMARGQGAQYGADEVEKTLSYPTAFFPANDFVSPSDIQNKRRSGSADANDAVDTAVARKLSTLRKSHALTKEFMMFSALKGELNTPTGKSLGNLYTDFGVTQKVIEFALDVDTTDVNSKIRELIRHIEDNAYTGSSVGGIRILVDASFFDQLISHPEIENAYLYFQAANQENSGQVMRDDLRRAFKHQGVTFEEYRGKYQTTDGTVTPFLEADSGLAFPTGVEDMFEIYFSPAHHIDYVNTAGEEVYAWSVPMRDGSGIEIFSQSSSVAINRRPQAVVKVWANTAP